MSPEDWRKIGESIRVRGGRPAAEQRADMVNRGAIDEKGNVLLGRSLTYPPKFRWAARNLIVAHHRDRPRLRGDLVDALKASAEPFVLVRVLLEECVDRGGPDGLDLAIDVLSACGDLAREYAAECPVDRDDSWYVLLRAAARSDTRYGHRLTFITSRMDHRNPGVREAVAHAFGDLGGAHAADGLRWMAGNDPDASVRSAAMEVLDDHG
jgi:hypothetical protein